MISRNANVVEISSCDNTRSGEESATSICWDRAGVLRPPHVGRSMKSLHQLHERLERIVFFYISSLLSSARRTFLYFYIIINRKAKGRRRGENAGSGGRRG